MLDTEHYSNRIESTLMAFLTALMVRLSAKMDMLSAAVLAAERSLPIDLSGETEDLTRAMRGQASQTQTIIAGVVIGAALLIGFFVVSQIDSALPAITDNDLSTDKNDTLDRIGDGLLIGGVVIIVLFAAVILRVLRGL